MPGREPVPATMPLLDAELLLRTLDGSISDHTRQAIEASDPALRAALVLGSPDFMRH